jgi:hypothetical protein
MGNAVFLVGVFPFLSTSAVTRWSRLERRWWMISPAKTGKRGGTVRFAFDYEGILQSLILKFTDNFVWFGLGGQKGGHLSVEVTDAFVGPLNFGPTTI